MKVHCVYIPDAILSVLRMSLLNQTRNESALCLYSGRKFCFDKTTGKCIVSLSGCIFCLQIVKAKISDAEGGKQRPHPDLDRPPP